MTKRIIILFLLMPFGLLAQTKKTKCVSRTSQELGAVVSSNGAMSTIALSGIQYWGFGKKKKHFKLGLGARLTSAFGSKSLEYITAPAKLTSGKTGPGVFFAEQQTQNIDSLTLNSSQVNSLNAYLALRYDFKKKWGVEFNIDLVGISLGGNKNAKLNYGDPASLSKSSDAKPTLGNVLLISDNDLGSLNSEFMISYQVKSNLKAKVGLSFLFTEYTLDNPVSYINSKGSTVSTDRYRTKNMMPAIGISYTIKNKNRK